VKFIPKRLQIFVLLHGVIPDRKEGRKLFKIHSVSTCSKKIKPTDVEFQRKSVSTDVAEQSAGIAEPNKCFGGTEHDKAEKSGGFDGTEHGTAEKPGGVVAQKMAQQKTPVVFVAQNMAQQKNPVVCDGTEHGTTEKSGGFWWHRKCHSRNRRWFLWHKIWHSRKTRWF
jgi:hypothetical protein